MAGPNLIQMIDRLNVAFTGATRKYVLWYDDNAEFAEEIESVQLQNDKVEVML